MTEWFWRDGSGISVHTSEPGTLLVHHKDALPDWVAIPDESPVDPGRKLRVLGSRKAPCPKCKTETPVTHFLLEDRFGIAQCLPGGCGFVVYQERELFEMGIHSVSAEVERNIPTEEIHKFFERHRAGDYGRLDAHDHKANASAIHYGTRILSEYSYEGRKLFLITEADRSQSTLLYADEY